MTLTRRVALVTGSGQGMGAAIARRLASDGAVVAVLDLDADHAAAVAAEITAAGGTALALGGVDVSSREQVDAAVQRVRDELGPPAILVNNAGMTGFSPFLDITDEVWDRLMRVNLYGPFYTTQAVVPDMAEAGWGRIVNISSSSAINGQKNMSHYVASKAGLVGMTRSLALELGPLGITVNAVPPGQIDTPMLRQAESEGRFGGSAEKVAAIVPVGRLGRGEDIAHAVSFFCSEEAGYITGQVLGVTGGRA